MLDGVVAARPRAVGGAAADLAATGTEMVGAGTLLLSVASAGEGIIAIEIQAPMTATTNGLGIG